MLSQELLLVTCLLLTNLFAVSLGGKPPGFQKKKVSPPQSCKKAVGRFVLVIKGRPELAGTGTEAGLPEKNSSHFLLLILQLEETANKYYNTALCFNQTPVPLFFI